MHCFRGLPKQPLTHPPKNKGLRLYSEDTYGLSLCKFCPGSFKTEDAISLAMSTKVRKVKCKGIFYDLLLVHLFVILLDQKKNENRR